MIKNGVLREPNSRLDGPKMVLHSMQCGMKFFKTKDCAKLLCKLRFYALIPHNFGLKAPPPINNQELLQRLVPLHYIVEICRTLSHKFSERSIWQVPQRDLIWRFPKNRIKINMN